MMPNPATFALAGLIGWPVAQSRSPVIQNHWLERHGIAGRYVLLPMAADQLERALRGLPLLGFRGCNVTMPHKQSVMGLLDRIDPAARRIGAVNTVVVAEDGTLGGFNNDGVGFVQSLDEAKPGWRADAGPILVYGAGGAARAVVAALLEHGARDIRIVSRTTARAEQLAAEIGGPLTTLGWEHRDEAMDDVALLVNATDRGMIGKSALDVSLARLPRAAIVSDLIYTPLETPFLAEARARGNLTVNGLGLLVHQARLAFEAWFGVRPEITPELLRAVAATF
ncbi:MAG TPA: shikimate dehydrogenase [Acetobacteraceae bacterium]|jgi:shikimate dehydrogenase|nr:shikimate dehydrogenase [Acetobacteraceae bacterium]